VARRRRVVPVVAFAYKVISIPIVARVGTGVGALVVGTGVGIDEGIIVGTDEGIVVG